MIDKEKVHTFLSQLPFSPEAEQALEKMTRAAKDHIGTEHILYGLIFTQEVRDILEKLGVNSSALIARTVNYFDKDDKHPDIYDEFTLPAKQALSNSNLLRRLENHPQITPLHVLISLLEGKMGMGFLLLLGDEAPQDADVLESIRRNLSEAVKELAEEKWKS
jgi:ATP-dependent Clp protease ATP-binding subunit ClpA